MSASQPAVDRRLAPMVAIVGNDAVISAAPATPVQLAHACLRRGFTVAVPASWGDELVAAEAMRRLESNDQGPAVLCVCPYVRSRLLAPGPDLAPFLVSLVSPPVAAARYLRTVYGDHGVHITYIGSCPSADDSSIDAHLTPDAFIADLAEHGIALSEQPLVFDSIVPPDRRRWCSLPGGVPSAEVLWSGTDPRTLVEIDRDDIATDLAQHIIAQEPVLLDLAPGLGCVCSGAIGATPPRHARSAVAGLEPPRALTPVIDPTTVVSLDVPVPEPLVAAPISASHTAVGAVPPAALELVLDELLGTGAGGESANDSAFDRDVATAVIVDLPPRSAHPDTSITVLADELRSHPPPVTEPGIARASTAEPDAVVELRTTAPVALDVAAASMRESAAPRAETLPDLAPSIATESGDLKRGDQPSILDLTEAPSSPVRRRTPPAMPSRYPGANIPKAMGADGRPLPRAYVAKRRTPPTGAPAIIGSASPEAAPNVAERESRSVLAASASGSLGTRSDAAVTPATTPAPLAPSAVVKQTPGLTESPKPPASPIDGAGTPESNGGRAPVAARAASQGVLIFLLLAAVLTLGVTAVIMLRP